jgi:hypothetical protein
VYTPQQESVTLFVAFCVEKYVQIPWNSIAPFILAVFFALLLVETRKFFSLSWPACCYHLCLHHTRHQQHPRTQTTPVGRATTSELAHFSFCGALAAMSNDEVCKDEKREKKRAMILNEIVSSEETYLNRLTITKDVFIVPIHERNLLSTAESEGQFGELEAIVVLHTSLASRLRAAHEDGTLTVSVGQIFSEICPEFGIYKGYLKCFEKALIKRGKLLTSNRKFADYLVEAKSDPRCQGFSMESLLIEPVQRIPRYRLLLEDLLKSTPDDHPDFERITAALDNICVIAAENNEAIRQQEELDKVYQVMKQMEYNGSINLLDNENRKFLKQDDLIRQCRRGRKSFRFWLFNDKLLYGEASAPLILGKFNLNREIGLTQCRVSSETENKEYVMRIQSPAKSFIVWFRDEDQRDAWVQAITQCVEASRSSIDEAGHVALAPIWYVCVHSSSTDNTHTPSLSTVLQALISKKSYESLFNYDHLLIYYFELSMLLLFH